MSYTLTKLLYLFANGTNEQDMHDQSKKLLCILKNEYSLTEDNLIIKNLSNKVDALEMLCFEVDSIDDINTQSLAEGTIKNLDEIKNDLKGCAIVSRINFFRKKIGEKFSTLKPDNLHLALDSKLHSIAPICKKCGTKMFYKENNKNGNPFWACPNFNSEIKCRYTKSLTENDKQYLEKFGFKI